MTRACFEAQQGGVTAPAQGPFDELLLVHAQEEGLKFFTADRQLIGHLLAITA